VDGNPSEFRTPIAQILCKARVDLSPGHAGSRSQMPISSNWRRRRLCQIAATRITGRHSSYVSSRAVEGQIPKPNTVNTLSASFTNMTNLWAGKIRAARVLPRSFESVFWRGHFGRFFNIGTETSRCRTFEFSPPTFSDKSARKPQSI